MVIEHVIATEAAAAAASVINRGGGISLLIDCGLVGAVDSGSFVLCAFGDFGC